MKNLILSLAFSGVAFTQSDWTSYGGNPQGWRFSDLKQINTTNVASMAPEWIFQSGIAGKWQAMPLVFDKQMYITGPGNHAFALDALTGKQVWHYSQPVPKGVNVCCGQPNRGFAVHGDLLIKVNMEATILAIDRRTGKVVWETVIDDYKKGYSATVAPLVIKDKVIIGIAGAEFGTRGFIDGFDVKTGKKLWRFWTVAGEGEPNGETWSGDSWKRGGGSNWITGTYDPELNLTYWGTGNPGPDLNGDHRKGDNLYTCSMVALDPDTGKLKWHFQFTPHDVHDWDSMGDPVLVDLTVKGQKVKSLIHADRNGYYYVLDRTNGKFLTAKAYTKVTWADGIGPDGRPKLIQGQDPSEAGTKACPGMGGGHNWQATSYSPQTGLYYFNTTDGCHLYYKTQQEFVEGLWYQASTVGAIPTEPLTGRLLAVDPASGDIQWQFETVSSPSAGVLATAGGLVFTGEKEGYFEAFDARTGKLLYRFQTGGVINSPPVSYSLNGKQYVAVTAGSSVIAFGVR